ncbi:MAG TPA: phosphoribosylanthranilate isomerase [Burkholderiaceae bacterium]|nr:phosphoribosylanthranilate isomerase [Burkholderiaceae bacterium]
MQRTRIKICGLTRVIDVRQACELGADAVGFVCYPQSPRFVDSELLAQLAAAVAPFVTPVLLFVDASASQVLRALQVVPNAMLQFHGHEDHAYCQSFRRPYMRAAAMGEDIDLLEFERQFPSAAALLADAPPAGLGGTGHVFDWKHLPASTARKLPLILAGGLDAGNVGAAIGLVRPHAVDVSSGVEETRGIKSETRMRSFVAAVVRADALSGEQ